jgi:hypothetical protein
VHRDRRQDRRLSRPAARRRLALSVARCDLCEGPPARRGSAPVVWSILKIGSRHPHPPCPVNKWEGAVAPSSVHENRLVLVRFTAWRQ